VIRPTNGGRTEAAKGIAHRTLPRTGPDQEDQTDRSDQFAGEPEAKERLRAHNAVGRSRYVSTHERKARGITHKVIAFEFGISINTVGNLAANAYKKLGVHGAAVAVHAHRDAHFCCGTRVDFGPIRERLKASRSTSSCPPRPRKGR